VGRLHFISSTITGINNFSDLILYSMLPASKDTYEKVGTLIARNGNQILPVIPSWPDKEHL
jgi:hypothetical protein